MAHNHPKLGAFGFVVRAVDTETFFAASNGLPVVLNAAAAMAREHRCDVKVTGVRDGFEHPIATLHGKQG